MDTANHKTFAGHRTSERDRFFYLKMLLGIGGVLIVSRFLQPSRLPYLCLFHTVTGLPCPTCGMTRAFHAMSLGHFTEAIGHHPLGPLFYGLTVFHGLVASLRLFGWKSGLLKIRNPVQWMIRGSLAVLAVCWVVRLLWIAIG